MSRCFLIHLCPRKGMPSARRTLRANIERLTALTDELTALLSQPVTTPDVIAAKLRVHTELAATVTRMLEELRRV